MAKASVVLGVITWLSIFIESLIPRASLGPILWLVILAGLVLAIWAIAVNSNRGLAIVGLVLNLLPVLLFLIAMLTLGTNEPGSPLS